MTDDNAARTSRWSATTAAGTRPPSIVRSEKETAPVDDSRAQTSSKQEGATDVEKDTPSPPQQNGTNTGSQETPKALDWDGADDHFNPHNWSPARKWFQTYTISGFAFVGTFAPSVFTPGIELEASNLSSTRLIATFVFSIYQLGLAFGGPLAAPLSETFGRRPIIFISLPIFALFILGTGFAHNMATLVVLRFFAGFFAAPSLSMGSGTLSDIWPPETRSGPMSLYMSTPFFGPALGPLLGAAVSRSHGWRWTSWLILLFTIVVVLAPAPFYIEFYKPILLRQRPKKRGLPVPRSATQGLSVPRTLSTYVSKTLTRPMRILLTEPIIVAFNAYSAFSFGLLYAFFAAFPYVFETECAFNSLQTGLTFLGLGVGVIAAITILFSKR